MYYKLDTDSVCLQVAR